MRVISADKRDERRIQEDSSAQLHHALAVKADVLGTKKLSDSDRMVFATNLGELYQEIERIDPSISFSKLFGDIFDEVTAESLVKKRRTVIIFDGEETNSQGLRATPHHYVEIALGLARRLSAEEVNTTALGMLKLIEGSSFDFQGAVRDKFTAQCEADLIQTLKHIVKSVRSNVDMDWLYEWSEDHPYITSGLTGELTAIKEGAESYLDFKVEDDGMQQRNCCPCVPLALLKIPFDGPVKTLTLPYTESQQANVEGNGVVKFISDRCLDALSIEPLTVEYTRNEGDLASYYVNQMAESKFDMVDLKLSVQMRIDLELRYSPTLARWEAIILYRELLEDGLLIQFDTVKTDLYGCEVQFIGWDSDESDLQTFAIVDSADRLVHLFSTQLLDLNFGHGLTQMPPGASDIGSSFNLTSSRVDDLALRTDLKITSLLHEFDTHKYVPAPSNSIAKLILENMAYAPEEARLDALMVKDAVAKEKMIKDFAASLENEFRSAFAENVSRGV